MRILIFSAITVLFASACSDQERIAQYEKQLKESNEALEKIIDYRRIVMKRRAAENPMKGGPWKDLSEQYYESSYLILLHLNQPSFIDSVINTLEHPEEIYIKHWNSLAVNLNSLSTNDSTIAKSLILNELNQILLFITNITSASSCGGGIPYIVPKLIPTGDSVIVFLTSDFRVQIDDFVVNFDEPSGQNFKPINTLGYFFLPNHHKEKSLNGTVEIIDNDGLYSWQIRFSKDSIHDPIFNKTP
ncbi:hypothetical protein [Owenweeksia hongkongensis]|uniref:hypothetical protein n=1 Tax=Owenweeksia hongkongensis TaxID=253245 RepID=UPI003A90D0D8